MGAVEANLSGAEHIVPIFAIAVEALQGPILSLNAKGQLHENVAYNDIDAVDL